MQRAGTRRLLVSLVLFGVALGKLGSAEDLPRPARGQVVYVPVYSEIPYAEGEKSLPLTATLSVRNADRRNSLSLSRVDYYDSSGKLVRSYLRSPRSIPPLGSVEYVVKESDRTGGVSASFLLEWGSEAPAAPPLIEAVMISTRSAQGISFSTSGRVLEERR